MGSIEQPQTLPKETKPTFSASENTKEYAQLFDSKDHLRSFREKFTIPSKANIKTKKLAKPGLPHPLPLLPTYT
jgi:kynureninase